MNGYFAIIPTKKRKDYFGAKFLIVSKSYYAQYKSWDEGQRLNLPTQFAQLAEGLYSYTGNIKDGKSQLISVGYYESITLAWLQIYYITKEVK